MSALPFAREPMRDSVRATGTAGVRHVHPANPNLSPVSREMTDVQDGHAAAELRERDLMQSLARWEEVEGCVDVCARVGTERERMHTDHHVSVGLVGLAADGARYGHGPSSDEGKGACETHFEFGVPWVAWHRLEQ
jgi:hypothetical protein